MNKAQLLSELKKKVERCRRCSLYKTRTKVVFGEGDIDAEIMLIGEASGYWEDQRGVPFCGAAGKVLDELLDSVGIEREEVYICNTLKCRPVTKNLENRAPSPEELKACTPYLARQIEIIRPKIICTLGNYATQFIFKKYGLEDQLQGISKIHGKVFEVKTLFTSLKIVPLYHPAVAVYNPNRKGILKEDFKILEKFKN